MSHRHMTEGLKKWDYWHLLTINGIQAMRVSVADCKKIAEQKGYDHYAVCRLEVTEDDITRLNLFSVLRKEESPSNL